MKCSTLSTILLGLLVVTGRGEAEVSTGEPRSGVTFPLSLSPDRNRPATRQALVGLGVRTRTIFRVEVYAVGLYADTRDSSGPRDVASSIQAGRVDRSLRLVTTRAVDGNRMRNAFTKAMRPRFRNARREGGLDGADSDWRAFASFFEMERLDGGTELVFSCDTDGRLESLLDGVSLPAIDSEALCFALFDVYIGPEPLSRKLKEDLLSRADEAATGGSR